MRSLLYVAVLVLAGCSAASVQRTLDSINQSIETGGPLTNSEVIAGLKQALEYGAGDAVDIASAENGFYKNPKIKIPFPKEAEQVKNIALDLGLDAQVQRFEETMNQAAQIAAEKATPIFVDAITSMTIADGFTILNGSDSAATHYLRTHTQQQLIESFQPVVQNAIQQVDLTNYWEPLATAYNASTVFTNKPKVNPDLDLYVTQKAVDGLFILLAKEEQEIREDPAARVTELLRRVFGNAK